jgi:CheY-like chemotaxis protein
MENSSSNGHLSASPRSSPGKDRATPRILVIDDQSHVRAAIMLALRARHLEAVAVDSGAAGLKAFAASRFDLAIVDIFMLEMDGLALIKALRARRPSLPVIAISGVHLDSSGSTALDLVPNVTDLSDIVCLPKPFRTDQLYQAIQTAMGNTP